MRLWFLFLFVIMLAWSLPAKASNLLAIDGRLILPHTGLQEGLFNLDGSWRFHLHKIIPEDDSCSESEGQNVDIMDYWDARVLGRNPDWKGTSSFCLVIENPAHQSLSIWWPERSSMDIYANGKLVFGGGYLKHGDTREIQHRQTGVLYLPSDPKITIVVHGNNEFMRWRKIRGEIFFGEINSLAKEKDLNMILGVFIMSTLLATGFYQFALYLLHRDRRETFFLGVFCVALVLRFASIGHSNLFSILSPEHLGGRWFGAGHVGYFLGAACFYHFLGITYPDLIRRRMMRMLWILALTFSVMVIVVGSEVFAITLLVFHIIGGSCMLAAMYVVLKAIRQGREGSIVLAFGTLFLSVTALADMIRSQGVGLGFDVFPFGQLIFATAASLLVSIRFSHAFRILSHLSHELSKIVPQHVIALLRSGTELERCMPTGEHEAVVLVFDVVGSTRVTDPGFRKALDHSMARFFDAIHQDYDADRLEATGYRIKEMGDGMICTIGFPFQVPHGEKPDHVALRLAERMCRIFHEEMSRLQTAQPIYCGIGLARGLVEGFFPRAGQKQYDLRGAPLTLATRYEAMRNPVYRKLGQQGSVIFIHDDVYQRLRATDQSEFQRWDTSLPGQRIRDDENASQAWFKFVKPSLANSPSSSMDAAG